MTQDLEDAMHRLLSSQSLSRDGEDLGKYAGPSVIRLIFHDHGALELFVNTL